MMFQNPRNTERKKICMKIFDLCGLQSEKPQRKAQIANCLQLDPNYSGTYSYFKEQLAKWLTDSYYEIKCNVNEYFQFGRFKRMTYQSREYLISLFKKCDKKISESEPPDEFTNQMLLKNPYMGYPNMGYIHPYAPYGLIPPGSAPAGYPTDSKRYQECMKLYNYSLNLQALYLQNPPKYGYPINQMYMQSPMGMSLPKYDLAQTPDMMKNPYLSYQIPSIPPHSHPHPSTYSIPQPPAPNPPAQINSQTKSSLAPKSKPQNPYTQAKLHKEKNRILLDENDPNVKKFIETQKKQLPQKSPFIIFPPNILKGHLEEIPQYLPKYAPTNHNNESSQIQILQKNNEVVIEHNDVAKIKKQTSIQKNKSFPKDNPTLKGHNQVPLFSSTANLCMSSEYKEEFKQCLCNGYGVAIQAYRCSACNQMYHYVCTMKKQTKDNRGMQQQNSVRKQLCHFCFMEDLDPLNKIQATIGVAYLTDIRHNKFSKAINFEVFDEYLTSSKNSKYEIQVRSMKLEDAASLIPQYTWPDECLIMLNSEKTFEFQALQNNSSLKKRKDTSVFLTNYIYHYNRNYINRRNLPLSLQLKEITIEEMNNKKIRNHNVFLLGIYLTRKKTPDELCEEIKRDPNNKVSFAVKAFSKGSEDDEQVEIQQIKVNLMDPFTWNIIDTPVRGRKCIHGQCFDLKTFLSFMDVQKIRQWKCPVCSKDCRSFYIDIQQLEAIKQFKKQQQEGHSHKLSKEISFHRDGRTTFIMLNEQDEENEQKKATEPGKTKIIAKDEKESL